MDKLRLIDIAEEQEELEGDDFVDVIVAVDDAGSIVWLRTTNNPSMAMEEYFQEDISINGNLGESKESPGIYKARFLIKSWRDYEGEYDSELVMADMKPIVLMDSVQLTEQS